MGADLTDPAVSARVPAFAGCVAAAAAALGAWWLARTTGFAVFAATAAVSTWSLTALAGLRSAAAPAWWRRLQLACGLAAAAVMPLYFAQTAGRHASGATDAQLRFAALAAAVLALGLHVLSGYAGRLHRTNPTPALGVVAALGGLLAWVHAAVAAALLAHIFLQLPWLPSAARAIWAAGALLAAEALALAFGRWLQPPHLRGETAPFGRSPVLAALRGDGGPLAALFAACRRAAGGGPNGHALGADVQAAAAPLFLLGLGALWASTAVTAIPVDSQGVLVAGGRFAAAALPPGLHFHAPWPWARAVPVPTGRVREILLGFERDLGGPVLWHEEHFAGERNLLVGRGEELLTLNVPVHYRIRDAVAWLRRTGDADAALAALGDRELLAAVAARPAFELMTTERSAVAARLHAGLQAAADRLGLGIEIVFVGLQDVHPPVPVAAAYHDVVSAKEQQLALVDLARTYAAQAGAAAQVGALQTRLAAETAAAERLALARGEAARFTAPLPLHRRHPGVFATRRRLETIESALTELRQLHVVPAGLRSRLHLYQGFDAAAIPR